MLARGCSIYYHKIYYMKRDKLISVEALVKEEVLRLGFKDYFPAALGTENTYAVRTKEGGFFF